MRFLLDESADARLASYLRSIGHDVTATTINHPARLKDEEVLDIARREDRVFITDDRDFGELVFARHRPHTGVMYLRLGEYAELAIKIERLAYVLTHHAAQRDRFLVVTHQGARVGTAPARGDEAPRTSGHFTLLRPGGAADTSRFPVAAAGD